MKESSYENWLLGDVDALSAMPKRFSLSQKTIQTVQPNKADRLDAQDILKKAAQGAAYDKIQNSVRIMSAAQPLRIAANSRFFRRFMRQLQHKEYANQSQKPVP